MSGPEPSFPHTAQRGVGDYTFDLLIEAVAGSQHEVSVDLALVDADGRRVGHLNGEFPWPSLAMVAEMLRAAVISHSSSPESSAPMARAERSGSGRPWTDDDKLALRQRLAEGLTVEQLAVEFDRSPRAIAFRLYEMGLGPFPGTDSPAPQQAKAPPAYTMADLRQTHANSHKRWTEDEDALLAARAGQGATVDELSVEFERNHNAIVARLARVGFPPPIPPA